MITECKKSKDINIDEANELFSLFLENMTPMIGKSGSNKAILTDEFKDNWINNLMNNEKEKVLIYKNNDELAAFIAIQELENENFIQDFHIKRDYQKDGKTFKYMIMEGVKHLDLSKDFSGDIWILNTHSREVFKHIGATFEDGKFRLSFEKMKNWLN